MSSLTSSVRWRRPLSVVVTLAILLASLLRGAVPAQAVSTTVVISQVYGGGGNTGAPYQNDYVELFNRGTTTASLSGWSVQYASATGTGNFGSNPVTSLTGSLAPGQYYLVKLAGGANGVPLPTSDATGTVNMSGTGGKVALVNTTTGLACNGGSTACSPSQLASIIDLVGWDGANFFEGSGAAPATTNTTAVFRAGSGCTDTDNNAADFTAAAPNPRNTASATHSCSTPLSGTGAANPSTVTAGNATLLTVAVTPATNPASTGIAVAGDLSAIGGSASQAFFDDGTNGDVTGGDNTFSFQATVSSGTTAGAKSLPVSISDAQSRTASTTIALTVNAVNACELAYTPIYSIQGSGPAAAITGNVTTQGVVVGDYEGASPTLRGFYLQDLNGDGNAATSDGIFVFNNNNNSISLGDVVRISGTAAEFQDQTQISLSSTPNIVNCGTGSVAPVDVTFPVPSATYLEQYEGMLVRFPQTLYVTEHFQLGRFGQVVMSADGRLRQPTNQVAPGAPALAMQAANNLNRIIVDDALQNQNPDPILFGRGGNPLSASNTLRGGDTATGMVGIMSYTWAGNSASGNAYRLRPINALGGGVPNFQPANPRPASAPNVGGNLHVAGMNLLNFFNTFDGLPDTVDNCTNGVGGPATDCRGADTQAEFDRQWPKTVAAIIGIGADVIGVNEIENDGYGPTSAIQFLVDRLNAATAPGTYAFIDVDAATGQVNALGTDAIKVGMIYKPAKVTPVGQTAALNSVAFVNGGDGAPRSRPSLAQAFQQNSNGARFVVDINHLKSKGSACDAPDAGDGQGNCNIVRVNAATALMAWLASDPTGTGDPDILMIGDYNSYAKEDPITTIRKGPDGVLNTSDDFTNMIESFLGPDAYSYVFDGQWGYLDHALGSPSIVSQVSAVGDYHINSDEPSVLDYNTDFKTANLQNTLYAPDEFRVSDHDPVLVGLNLNAPPAVSITNLPYMVNEGGSIEVSAAGSDPDGGTLTYAWDLDDNGSFETAGQSTTFSAAGIDGPSSRTIRVQVTDNGGLTATAQATIAILNAAPSVSAPSVSPEPSIQGASVNASATFSDPGPNDAPFTCTVNYGDGSGAIAATVSGGTCTGPAHTYATIGSYTVTVSVTDKDGGTGSNSATHTVIYNFSGFFQPIDNLPTLNVVKAGSGIPVRFSLGGNQGLNIFEAGYPKSQVIACDPTAPVDGIEETVTAGGSNLSYDSATDQYVYAWKTDKAWANTCRQLVVKLNDGTYHRANFSFTK